MTPIGESTAALDAGTRTSLQRDLLDWWDSGHRDLPWRRTSDPYAILVSEIMLQQTQVSRVVPKFNAFMGRFPSLQALAAAPVADVISEWSGLGYNRRAVNLHRLARVVVERYGGVLPATSAELRDLPGIGDYTARAVAAIAFGEPAAAVDTNVRRVLTRVVDGPDSQRSAASVQRLADEVLARERPSHWNQALMELGARVCLPVPDCPACPLRRLCRTAPAAGQIRERRAAYRVGARGTTPRYEQSPRFYRGRIVDVLRAHEGEGPLSVESVGARLRLDYTTADRPWLEGLLAGLVRDGLVHRQDDLLSLPDD